MTPTQTFYLCGINPILEALRAGSPIEKIFLRFGTTLDQRINRLARQQGIPISTLSRERFAEIVNQSGVHHHQGIIALRQAYQYLELEYLLNSLSSSEDALLVACDQITDPYNLGAIVRTATAAGVNAIIIPYHHAAPITPVAVRAAAGAFEHIPIIRTGSLVTTLTKLKEHGYWIIGSGTHGTHSYTASLYDRPIVIVIGNEGSGMRRSVERICDAIISIPLHPAVESLNASVATGVILFEVMRQRSTKRKSLQA